MKVFCVFEYGRPRNHAILMGLSIPVLPIFRFHINPKHLKFVYSIYNILQKYFGKIKDYKYICIVI